VTIRTSPSLAELGIPKSARNPIPFAADVSSSPPPSLTCCVESIALPVRDNVNSVFFVCILIPVFAGFQAPLDRKHSPSTIFLSDDFLLPSPSEALFFLLFFLEVGFWPIDSILWDTVSCFPHRRETSVGPECSPQGPLSHPLSFWHELEPVLDCSSRALLLPPPPTVPSSSTVFGRMLSETPPPSLTRRIFPQFEPCFLGITLMFFLNFT